MKSLPALIVAIMVTTAAYAQAPSAPPAGATSKINLSLEQRHVIKENVLPDRAAAPPRSEGAVVEVGAIVPETVTIKPLPPLVAQKVPQVGSYSYFLDGERIVLVEAQTRKVVEIVD